MSTRSRAGQWITLPNLITVVRLALVVPVAVLIMQGTQPGLVVLLLIAFGASDWIDGYLARKLDQTSAVGAILDPIADRVGIGVIVGALVVAGQLQPWILVMIVAADVGVAVAYLIAGLPRPPQVTRLGKVRTAILMTGLAITSVALLPGLASLAMVGFLLCAAGAILHLAASTGYLRMLRQIAPVGASTGN